jgi:hypothetical protein
MEIVFNRLFKIDIAETTASARPEYQNLDNFKIYIQGMLEQISQKEPDRYYKFKSEYTEIHSLVKIILTNKTYEEECKAIANRLLNKEKDAQTDLDKKKLGKNIIKGMLIISLVRMTDNARKFIVLKVDYDEFISEMTGEIVTGLSIRQKVYKAFICEINNANHIINISIFDTNTPASIYWWDKFLELESIVTDEENTKKAFNAIAKYILDPIKAKYKHDYLLLWNSTIAYMRSEGEFSIDYYKDSIIGAYVPYDETLVITELKAKIDRLPRKCGFERRFNKTPKEIHKRFKDTIRLTGEIDLVIKHDVANPQKTFKPHEDADGKYIMIRSEEGYDYANMVEHTSI